MLSMVTVKGFGIEGRFWNVVRWLFVIIMGWRFNSGEFVCFQGGIGMFEVDQEGRFVTLVMVATGKSSV